MTRTYIDAQPPVTLAELKSHVLITGSDFDDVLGTDLRAAIAATENYTGMMVWRSTCVITARCGSVTLPVRNVRSITSVSLDGTVLAASAYDYDPDSNVVSLKERRTFNQMEVTFVAGYIAGVGCDIPHDMKAAILLQAANIFSYPDDPARSMPTASEKLLYPYRNFNV